MKVLAWILCASTLCADPIFRKINGELVEVLSMQPYHIKVVQVVGRDILARASSSDPALYYFKNVPSADSLVDGEWVDVRAMPDGFHEYKTVLGANARVYAYNCGTIPSAEETAPLLKTWREHEALTRARIEKEEAAVREAKAKAEASSRAQMANRERARVAKIISYQLTQASNGFPSFQLEIGKRYLKGDGVETNIDLARHWLSSAATNGESQAVKLLSSIPTR